MLMEGWKDKEKEIAVLLFLSSFFILSSACSGGNCQLLESCSTANDCAPGLYCGNCPTANRRQPVCTRGQANIPTTIVFKELHSTIKNYIMVGCADHNVHYYDLRNISQPVHVFSGHKKAVSYVHFLSPNELASTSTDSTLRLWDVKENKLLQIYRGHITEKNFVGLTADSEYLSCGNETNEVFVYHKGGNKEELKRALKRPL